MRGSTLFLTLLFSSAIVFAQNRGRIEGIVTDPEAKAIPGAQVRVKKTETGAVRSVTTDGTGTFDVPGLSPGEYSIEVEAKGFATATRSTRLEVGQSMRMDMALGLGTAKQELTVSANVETLKTDDTSIGEVVESVAVQQLPLNGRMLLDLALTVPGSHMSHGAQEGNMNPLYWRPGQNSALSIGGNRPNANYFLIDGATNTDPTFNAQSLSLSPDAVREFQVQTGSYNAELGGAGGGQVNIVTRGGSTQYHGTVYEFARNGALDAYSFNELIGGKFLVQNNFGAAVGGPVIGKKTFFFTNYEGFRKVKADTTTATVPTAAEALGDFNSSGAPIFNPFASRANPDFDPSKPVSRTNSQILRDPFPNNRIPDALLNPAAATMLKSYVVRPNLPGVVGTAASNNYRDQRNERNFTDQGTLRLDQVFERGDTVSGRYSLGLERGYTPQLLPGFGLDHDNRVQHANITWTRLISPKLVNIATIGLMRLAMSHFEENSYKNDIVTQLGIQGVNFGGPRAWGAPQFNVQGYSVFGDIYQATPMQAWDTMIEARDSLTWQHGHHNVKFGGGVRRLIWPMWAYVLSRGYYQFTNGYTTQTATSDGTGSALASFELGLPSVRQRQVGSPHMNLRQWYVDAYVQDTWRITPNTTLNLGVRYEFMSPLIDVSNKWAGLFVSPTALTAYIGGQVDTPRGLLFPPKLNFAPRLGIARQIPALGMVFRAGYGIFFSPIDMNSWCNMLHNVPLIFAETNQSDAFIPTITSFNFNPPVVGSTVTSFQAFDAYQKPQYVQHWAAALEKSITRETTLEIGYQGDRGLHLQRSHLINNAPPGPGLIQPRRRYGFATFLPGTEFPSDVTVVSSRIPVSALNWLENTAKNWYDAAYINVRRRFSGGLTFMANYTYAKNLSNAPDFRSPMFEAAIPQDNDNLFAEKGPGCDLRHRFVLSGVFDVPALGNLGWMKAASRGWQLSSIYQAQSGFPFTVSVFGDTANTGTVLGENAVRANYNGAPVFTDQTQTPNKWLNTAAFSTPAAYTYGNSGRNNVYGPGQQTLDITLARKFAINERTTFELRLGAFNSLNKVNLATPNRYVNTPQFGTITSPDTPGRQVQISARLSL